MNKIKMKLACLMIFICTTILGTTVFAESIENFLLPMEFTDSFEEYRNLSNEEKSGIIPPRAYEVKKAETEVNNPLRVMRTLGATLSSRFSLKDEIPNNVVVKDQARTGICWAFAALSSLETNLGLTVNRNKVYDFSERHMDYGMVRTTANSGINKYGVSRAPTDEGNFDLALGYLTNGIGAVEEKEMPFNESAELISLSELLNKKVVTQVYDTISFAEPKNTSERENLIKQMKEHIQNYGSISVAIHGAQLDETEYYNNYTGALYCDNTKVSLDHAVSIIGWDDNYDKNNFSEKHRPQNNGAWIVKNSWGEIEGEIPRSEFIEMLKDQDPTLDVSKITDEILIEFCKQYMDLNIEIVDGMVRALIGDHGFMYVSYEDALVYTMVDVITKSSETIDYDNIYQHNYTGAGFALKVNLPKAYVATIFDRENKANEFLRYVSMNTPETVTCKVYVNPNNSSTAKQNLVGPIALKSGTSATFDAGYHTLEFADPIELKGESFVVVVEIEGKNGSSVNISLESRIPNTYFDSVDIASNKCFVTVESNFNSNTWTNLSTLLSQGISYDSDSTVKAFTSFGVTDDSLKSIEIKTPPTKTKYFEGENFDKTGMVVQANYNNGKSVEITDYSITNGNNLVAGQTDIIISYENKTVVQKITVEKNSVVSLSIKEPPTRTEYDAGQSFDKTGMVVEATFKDGTKTVITDYEIINGDNLLNNQTYVTISYGGVTVNVEVTVNKNELVKLEISKAPTKINYIEGQDFDKTGMVVIATYENGDEVEITGYTLEGDKNLKVDQTYVTIKFDGKEVKQNITVVNKTVTSIFITKKPNKLSYIQNKEELDLTGGIIRVTYNDNSTSEIPMTEKMVTVSGFDNTNLGSVLVTVSYYEKTATFEVTIIEEEKPVNFVLNTPKFYPENGKIYMESANLMNSYAIMDIVVTGVDRYLENDSYEYYYYISKNPEETSITKWTAIEETQNEQNRIKFNLDTRKMPNFLQVATADVVYLYVKEVATKGGNQLTKVSDAITIDETKKIDADLYIDGVLQKDDSGSGTITPNPTKPVGSGGDGTTYTGGSMPQTGEKTIIALIIIISIISLVVYIRYRKISKELKQ